MLHYCNYRMGPYLLFCFFQIYGPSKHNDYESKSFPGINDAIEKAKYLNTAEAWHLVQHEVWRVSRAVRHASLILNGELTWIIYYNVDYCESILLQKNWSVLIPSFIKLYLGLHFRSFTIMSLPIASAPICYGFHLVLVAPSRHHIISFFGTRVGKKKKHLSIVLRTNHLKWISHLKGSSNLTMEEKDGWRTPHSSCTYRTYRPQWYQWYAAS